ncbi:MAG: deoxynucleoside kinase, partial [Terriglobales bacterium]
AGDRRAHCSPPARASSSKRSMDRFRHIAVEGPIGAGKTSLARRLASRLAADLVLEQPEDNPFLARFYQDMARYALPTQLFFLFQRARQLEALAQPDMFGRPTVTDFLLEKDPLFARITLSGEEMALYQKIYDAIRPQAPAPDLVVYLQAQPATLYERVRRRAAEYERGIGEDYLALLAEGYARFFYSYGAAPVLIVNSENLNFAARDADLELLLARMRGMKSRREFFSVA